MEIKKFKSLVSILIIVYQMIPAQIVINEFMASNSNTIADNDGEFDDWLELVNHSADTINLAGWYLSDNDSNPFKHQFSDSILIFPDSFLLLWADDDEEQGTDHLNFKISSGGEELLLTNPDQALIDSVIFGQQEGDNSYGRYPDIVGDWGVMDTPTPGFTNSVHDTSQYSQNALVSHEPGLYEDQLNISLLSDVDGVEIFYSLDGSVPDASSSQYLGPFLLLESTVLRVVTIEPGLLPSRVQTYHYLINTNFHLPVMALAIEPDDFPIGSQEYSLHVTYFNEEGEVGFSTDAGIERHGSSSEQNPYRIEFKAEYGQSHIDYPVFANRTHTRYKRLVLRNASNDRFPISGNNNRAHLRDGIIQTVYSQLYPNGGYSSFKSLHLYINNEYWGIYHLRERQDRYYIEDVFGHEDVDLLERAFNFTGNRNAIEGDWDSYNSLESFIDSVDMNLSENFEYLKSNIYYEEFLDYWMLQVFMGNFDWLANNIKYFRPRSGEDKWRWLVWDTDHGLGMDYFDSGIHWGNVQTDYLSWSTGLEGPRIWQGENNRVIRAILRNDEGRTDFINRFADLINTTFASQNVLGVLDSLLDIISPDMSYHADRWNATIPSWEVGVNNVRNYITQRPTYVVNHIKNKFDLDAAYTITLEVPDTYAGSVQINSILIHEFPWTGTYFSNTPIEIFTVSEQDSQSFFWENLNSLSQTIHLDSLEGNTTFRLVPINASRNALVINEFLAESDSCCLDDYGELENFIELYNGSDSTIILNGIMLTNSLLDTAYSIIEDTSLISLDPDELIVFWNDSDSSQGFNHLNFQLNGNGDQIYLISAIDSLVLDSVVFDTQKVDISFGRYSDGSDTWIDLYPTPGEYNIGMFPIVNLLQDSIVFATISPYDSLAVDIQLFNNGYSELTISDVLIENEYIHANFDTPLTLFSGISDTLSFTFSPIEIGVLSSQVVLETNDPIRPTIMIHFSGYVENAVHPIITNIKDTPEDEGFRVSLSFLPSRYDGIDTSEIVNEYSIFRLNTDSVGFHWDSVGFMYATQDSIYNIDVPTSCNISSDSLCQSLFRVSTKLENADTIVWSNIFEGFSIDNLSPSAPEGLSALEVDNYLIVQWETNQEQDVKCYILDKSADSLFLTDQYPSFFTEDTFFIDSAYESQSIVYYRLTAIDNSGNKSMYSDTIKYPDPSLFIKDNKLIPLQFSLLQNYPNPFNPLTAILYTLPNDIVVKITIYDVLGRKVKILVNAIQTAGYKTIKWNATNDRNESVSAGIYFYMIEAGDFNKTRKMILLR